MKFIKKGRIYIPNGSKKWSKTHAQLPVADFIENENIIRIYFSTRDEYGRSLPDYIEVNADNPTEILTTNQTPILPLGQLGEFDDCGVMPSWVVNKNNEKWLYYIGWNVRNTIPYHNSVGLAISKDGGKYFSKCLFFRGRVNISISTSTANWSFCRRRSAKPQQLRTFLVFANLGSTTSHPQICYHACLKGKV